MIFNETICFVFECVSDSSFRRVLCHNTGRSMTETTTLTEFEENVSFDADDPDFAPSPPAIRNVLRDAQRFVENAKFDVKGRHIFLTLFIIASGASAYLL